MRGDGTVTNSCADKRVIFPDKLADLIAEVALLITQSFSKDLEEIVLQTWEI